jgi:hypothetical protein
MRPFLLSIALTCITFSHYSQLTEKKFHLRGQYSLGGFDGLIFNEVGLDLEWHLHKNIGINYNVKYLSRNDNFRQIHAPMGLAGGPIVMYASLMGWGDADDFQGASIGKAGIALGLIMMALPDGVSGHIPLGYKWDLSPYANVLGIDFVKNKTNGDTWIKYACSFGSRVHYSFNDLITFSAFLETRKTAGYSFGFGGGLGAGIAFGSGDH